MSPSCTRYCVQYWSCWLLLPMICCVQTPAHRASCPSMRVAMFACMATNCCSGVAVVGLFGFSVSPGPCRKSLHPAPNTTSARAAPALVIEFIAVSSRRLVIQGELHDPRLRQGGVEPVDAPVGVLRPAQVDLRVEARVVGPQL